MPFLEIITRCYKREKSLELNKYFLSKQTDKDFIQTLLIDEIGIGIPKANRGLYEYSQNVIGQYIYILDDDDFCTYRFFIEDLKRLCVLKNNPPVIMVMFDCMDNGILPPATKWGIRPRLNKISMSSFIVRNDIFKQYAEHFHEDIAADFNFIDNVFKNIDNSEIVWWPKIIGKVSKKSNGEHE